MMHYLAPKLQEGMWNNSSNRNGSRDQTDGFHQGLRHSILCFTAGRNELDLLASMKRSLKGKLWRGPS
jgi:hypothetical protein